MNDSLLIVDFCNTVIRSLAVHLQLEYDSIPTGGLFGTINQFANQMKKYTPRSIVVCKDSGPYLRKKLFPQYKANRKTEVNKEFNEQIKINFDLVDTFLEQLQIPVWQIPGLEADDLIARLVYTQAKNYKKIIILSNDDDLNQLLEHDNVSLLRKNKEYGYDQFKQDYPTIEPSSWAMLTSLSGTHNGVKGLDRVGLKTAIKYMNNLDKLEQIYEQHSQLIEDNYTLITLPFPMFDWKNDPVPQLDTPVINETALIRYLYQYGIRYSTVMMEAFQTYSIRNSQRFFTE